MDSTDTPPVGPSELQHAHHLHRVASPGAPDFPLEIIRRELQTGDTGLEAPPLSKSFGTTTTHFPQVDLDVDVGLSLDVLYPVDPRLQFSVF